MTRRAAAGPRRPSGDGRPEPIELAAISARTQAAEVVGEITGTRVSRVAYDHRKVLPADPVSSAGDLFCCFEGERSDGHAYAEAAVERGAVALLVEHRVATSRLVPQLVTAPGRARAAMALAACAVAGDPALELVTAGVTGTNGKTTTTHLLRAVFERHGWRTAVIGTLGGARTTPEAPDLQTAFRCAVSGGMQAVALEVTSHALVQHRADGYRHDVVVFTNLSQDHLDYHGTMEAYFEAKAVLFRPEHAKAGVVNADDPYGRRLLERHEELALGAFSLSDAEHLEVSIGGSTFSLQGEKVELRLAGLPNVYNALAAAAAAGMVGIDAATIAAGLSEATVVPGRFESVPNALSLPVLVDYAHTPAGLRSVLEVARRSAEGRVLVVFGAGGDRDRTKRPMMGKVACELADMVVVTSDNPRHEDPVAIIDQVRAGCGIPGRTFVEPDRRQAILLALSAARPGDVVVVAGKGHETTQQVGDELLPFDDRTVVAELAAALAEGTGLG